MGVPAASLPVQPQKVTGKGVGVSSIMVHLHLTAAAVYQQSSALWAPMFSQAVWDAGEKWTRNRLCCCNLLCQAATFICFLPVVSLVPLNHWDKSAEPSLKEEGEGGMCE